MNQNWLKKGMATILVCILMINLVAIKPATANSNGITEGQFLSMVLKQFAAVELAKMPPDGTYIFAKEYHLAKRLGLPVVGTSYTTFGDDRLSNKSAAQLLAQGFTGKILTEKQAIEWLTSNKLVNTFVPDAYVTKADAEQILKELTAKGFNKLMKTPNGKIGQYRVDSFFKPIKTYTSYSEAYAHAKRYTYTKVVDTATGMVLWYPKQNSKILFHLHVDGKRAAGFDTEANALVYAKKLDKHFSRIIDGKINHSVWDNYNHFVVRNPSGVNVPFKTIDEANRHAVETEGQKSYIHPLDDDVNKYKHAFLSQKSAGIGNGVLIYNGFEIDKKKAQYQRYELSNGGVFPERFFKPYIAYEKDGKFLDTFFDTFIILGRYYSDKGQFEETSTNQANYREWKWYKDRTFRSGGAIDRLNKDVSAIPQVKKVKVFVSIPYPKDEGNLVKLDGKAVKADYVNRLALVKWYMDSVHKEFASGKFPNLQFEGFYWMNETVISKEDEKLVTEVGKLIHAEGKRFIFSPHAKATNFRNWKKYGFDGAYFQSNAQDGVGEVDRIQRLHWGYMNSFSYGMGVNLELEDTDFSEVENVMESFDQYMEFGKRYRVQGSSTIMYQGTVMINRFGVANIRGYENLYRNYYDRIYRFLKNKPEPVED
ncbi:DUF4855 domain-containing protein [Pseudoneobacillus sp. C159]